VTVQHRHGLERQEAIALSEKSQFDLLRVDEHLADVDPHALFDELVTRQPNAFRFLMHSRKENIPSPSDAEVCKWETRR